VLAQRAPSAPASSAIRTVVMRTTQTKRQLSLTSGCYKQRKGWGLSALSVLPPVPSAPASPGISTPAKVDLRTPVPSTPPPPPSSVATVSLGRCTGHGVDRGCQRSHAYRGSDGCPYRANAPKHGNRHRRDSLGQELSHALTLLSSERDNRITQFANGCSGGISVPNTP
jgi:hypothetical protein